MSKESTVWTKWWWIRLDQFRAWSPDERRAVRSFALTWVMTIVVLSYPAWLVLDQLLGFSFERSLAIWMIVAWPINLPGLRGLTSTLFPSAITRGDTAAAARLGGAVYLPTNEFWIRGFWWIDATPTKGDWSDEQMKIRSRNVLVSFSIFVPAFLIVASALTDRGMSERLAATIAFGLIMPASLYAGRQIGRALWPDLVKKADDDAVKFANKSVPPRT